MNDVLRAEGLVKCFGALRASNGLNLSLKTGELHAVIGPNGAGKTTFLAQLSGELPPDSGTIHFQGHDITRTRVAARALMGIGRSYQITSVFQNFTVLENVMLAVQARQGSSFRFWSQVGRDARLTAPALAALEQVRLQHLAARPADSLGYGEKRQLEIAMTLAMEPKVLLLDEPMAGMSQSESARLVELLKGLKRQYSILLVEHDMAAVFALADRISVLVYGEVIACDTPDEIQKNEQVQLAYLGG